MSLVPSKVMTDSRLFISLISGDISAIVSRVVVQLLISYKEDEGYKEGE